MALQHFDPMMYYHEYNLCFLLHIIIEIPAFLNFFVFPSGQLGTATPHAHAVIRQYALLILSSVLVSFAFLRRPADCLSGQVAGALAVYHFGPSVRSLNRLSRRMQLKKPLIPSEAAFYLLLHSLCGASLGLYWWNHCLSTFLIVR